MGVHTAEYYSQEQLQDARQSVSIGGGRGFGRCSSTAVLWRTDPARLPWRGFILTRVVLFRMDSSSLDLASNSLDLASNNNNFNLTRLVNHVKSSAATQSLVSTGAPRPCSRSHLDSLKLVAHSSVSENKLSSHTL